MNKTQEEFLNDMKDLKVIVFQTESPKKGEDGYCNYIRECMIMGDSVEVGNIINVTVNDKSYIGKVLVLWKGGFKILLRGTKEWKSGQNVKHFSYHSIDEVTKIK